MSDDFQHLHMSAIDVDDDEWQLAAWFFKDQAKLRPLATLDYNQGLFAVTGTFRAQHREHGFLVFSHADFESMFGAFPLGQIAFEDLTVCPYSYDASTGSWVNVLTGTNPLLFHFAGNDWLCACEIFRAEGYENVPHKFRKNCEENYERWRCRVSEGIQQVALSVDPNEQVFLMDDAGESDVRVHNGEIEQADLKRFHLDEETTQRMLQADPYNSSTPAKTVLAAVLAVVSSATICCL